MNHPKSKEIYDECAKQGILIRYFEAQDSTAKNMQSLRFGLPANKEQWTRLTNVLRKTIDTIENNKENTESYV